MKKYDVVIIGCGIAGMTCAIYLKRGGINPCPPWNCSGYWNCCPPGRPLRRGGSAAWRCGR